MSMFPQFAHQVPVSIIAAFLRRVLMLLDLTSQLRCGRIAAVIVLVPVALLLPADKPFFITTIAMLVCFYAAYSCFFQRDRRQDQRICSNKDDYGRHRRYCSCKELTCPSVF